MALGCESMAGLLQVRNGQLEKEARELRAENATLQSHMDQAKHAAESGEKVSLASSFDSNSLHGHIIGCPSHVMQGQHPGDVLNNRDTFISVSGPSWREVWGSRV